MLTKEIRAILEAARPAGWVMEPEAKRFFSIAGLDVTRFVWARTLKEATDFAREIGYPVVAKVISPKVIHKSEVSGVAVGIADDRALEGVFDRFGRIDGFSGVLVEESLRGVEVIIGGTIDHQFGPVVLFGMGGIAVEVYKDVAIRMAPLRFEDVGFMVMSLKARKFLEGFRGSAPVNMQVLTSLLMRFSEIMAALDGVVESIDLNPVICTQERCIIADARIMLGNGRGLGG